MCTISRYVHFTIRNSRISRSSDLRSGAPDASCITRVNLLAEVYIHKKGVFATILEAPCDLQIFKYDQRE